MKRSVKAETRPVQAMEAEALWYVAPGKAELRPAELREPRIGELLVRTLYSGLSRGTERLVFQGDVPESEWKRMRAPAQEGEFPFPVKYGYCAVGTVEAGPSPLLNRTVFALYPHQSRFVIPIERAVLIPENIPPQRAVLTANLETALNVLWDGSAAPGDRIVIIGAGIVGLLVASLAAQLPGAEVTVVDIDPARKTLAEKMGARFAEPKDAPHDADLVIHASASEKGLALAFECAGTEATIVEASWHGASACQLRLGGAFHSRRLKLISSQVGEIASSRKLRWNHRRRLEAAVRLLSDKRLDALLGEEIPFEKLPKELPRLFAPDAPGVGALVRY
jgi:2-desacetyl-2-hydroxyethyl bacteriochlorophyllide A dehydrogenase